jgi:hypothetical protein
MTLGQIRPTGRSARFALLIGRFHERPGFNISQMHLNMRALRVALMPQGRSPLYPEILLWLATMSADSARRLQTPLALGKTCRLETFQIPDSSLRGVLPRH